MSPRQLTSRIINEVQQQLQGFAPQRPETDREHLAALAKAVLGSVDLRDLKGTPSARLVPQFEDLLGLLSLRRKGEIKVELSYQEDTDTLVIVSCLEDQPFLVSTMRAALAAEHYEIRRSLNAIVRVRRDPAGKLVGIGTGNAESLMRIEVSLPGSSGGRDGGGVPSGLQARITNRLALAQAMVRDFDPMSKTIEQLADGYFAAAADLHGEAGTAVRESEALLRWLCDENFVLFSVERFDTSGERGEVLGISTIRNVERDESLRKPSAHRHIRYERSPEESPVHRSGKPGYFVATAFGSDGSTDGVVLIEGLFTYKALHTPPEQIPVINTVLHGMLEDRQVASASERGKNITNAFNSLPLEYLLSEDRERIWELTDRILRAEAEGGSDVHIRIGEGSRFAFVFVALPRWQFSEELRQQVQDVLLQHLGGSYADYGVYIDRYDNAVIHFYVTGVGPLREADTDALRDKVLAHARTWADRLREAVTDIAPEGREEELFEIYEDAFNEEHKRRCSVARIKGDIRCLEDLRKGAQNSCDLYESEFGDFPGSLNLRIFSREPLNLSRELPVLSGFGFEVIDEYSRAILVPHLPPVDMDNFRFEMPPEHIGRVLARRANIVAAIQEVFEGKAGEDDLNRLIVVSDLTVRDVEVLRAYVAHMHQLRLPFDVAVIRSALVDHPLVASALMQWLAARFDPEVATDELAELTEATLAKELREITDYTADRVLQAVAELVRATRRTNAYVADRDAGEALAFKIAARKLSYGPEPKPFREIWVSHPELEGVHLRGGKVARGGLRFSDRPDDFRTEIHGLMATQMVKNVLIVPMGAKGGFVLKHPPAGREALQAAGDHFYGIFIRALLSVTDNVVDGEVRTPKGILRYREEDDPYLVVAADKGTAHLSDTANGISAEHGFWLDDAFASGGSHGYDHKKTGITARGAWEVTRRAFNELGVDPEADVITVVGVGDMSGDVFGNGLLRSRTMKLVAAFNHIHIFIDPDPDPAASFDERQRMFDLPRSTWEDYSAQVLSEGGGVYPRKSKEVPLSPQARARLGLDAERSYNGDEVIMAILRLEVDLCWMGGIGTYIKAKEESNSEVGDKANDSVRVDACDLRCRVLAEGANLAITDRGRTEFARKGGLNYNAFLDNSGGVDTSDHEVNIKILFAPLLTADAVTRDARNEVLVECEEEVVQMVLANNRAQSRMVSFDVERSKVDVFRYARALRELAQRVPFSPESFSLPSDDELYNRSRKGQGLYKCEGAVLGSHAKMLAYRLLLEGEPLADDVVDRFVTAYFPRRVIDLAGRDAVRSHLLRREIATTMIVNHVVDNMGATFFTEVEVGTLKSLTEITEAYLQAAAAADLPSIQAELYALEDKHRMGAVYEAMAFIKHSLEDATFYLLDQMDLPPLDEAATAQVRDLLANVDEALPPGSRGRTAQRLARFEALGLPRELAARIVKLRYLTVVLDAVRMSAGLGREPKKMLWLRLSVTDAISFNDLNQAIDRMDLDSPWDGPSVSAMRRQLNFHVHKLVRMVKGDDVQGMVDEAGLRDFSARVSEMAETNPTISGLVMLDDWLRRLLPPLAEVSTPLVKGKG
ncbi:MAG: NAD-glutamate dehydrogenase [Myxococcales bacterium]|nr:NAD-glutamate dehydrogenase [Myxococcales bacterium]